MGDQMLRTCLLYAQYGPHTQTGFNRVKYAVVRTNAARTNSLRTHEITGGINVPYERATTPLAASYLWEFRSRLD